MYRSSSMGILVYTPELPCEAADSRHDFIPICLSAKPRAIMLKDVSARGIKWCCYFSLKVFFSQKDNLLLYSFLFFSMTLTLKKHRIYSA